MKNIGGSDANSLTEQSIKAKLTSPDLMLVEIMRTINSGELVITLNHGVPQVIMVASRN